MAAHSYWRIRYGTHGSDNAQFAEVYFTDVTGSDLCSGGSVVYSSQFNGTTFAAANAFDRNNATGYASAGHTGQWIGYHFASPVEVFRVGVTGSAAFPSQNARVYLVEYSDDGSTWTLHSRFTSSSAMTAGEYREFVLVPLVLDDFDALPHRYWKIDVLQNSISDGFTTATEIDLLDASDVSLNDAHGGTPSATSAQVPYPITNAFDNNTATQWYTADISSVGCSLSYDFGSGNEYTVAKLRVSSPSSSFTRTGGQYMVSYSDDGSTWTVRHVTEIVTWTASETKTFAFADAPAASITDAWGFDYAVLAGAVEGSFTFDYAIEELVVEGSFTFDYAVFGAVEGSFTFDYAVYLYGTFGFSYRIAADLGDLYGYVNIFAGSTTRDKASTTLIRQGRTINQTEIATAGELSIFELYVNAPAATVNFSHFYSDFYERIWVSPADYRLSNPRIGFAYTFYLWNAYSIVNSLNDAYPTDLDGIDFTEEDDLSLSFGPIEQKSLSFVIGADAPATVDGYFDFAFDYGDARMAIYALVLGVLRTLPSEPMTEVWSWYTMLEISRDGTEQRQARRVQPRTMLAYEVMLVDEDDRISAYQQLFSFATRSVLVPMFQYATALDAPAVTSDTRLYFDLEQSDIRASEYLILYNRYTNAFDLAQVSTLNADGVNLVTPLTFDLGDDWEVLPGRLMRLPNASSMGIGAFLGTLTLKGESTGFRVLERPGSSVTLDTYDGIPILPWRPIAADEIDETFVSDVEVLDNNATEPLQRSSFTNPFVQSEKTWFIERETELDWWRTFFDYVKGQLRSFLMPTWREDLPLYVQPNLGDIDLFTTNLSYLDYFDHDTYLYVMVQSDAGVIYRKVTSAAVVDGLVRVTLDASITSDAGANVNMVVSFLNVVRLDDDDVTLEHYVNYTLLTLQTRTVNG